MILSNFFWASVSSSIKMRVMLIIPQRIISRFKWESIWSIDVSYSYHLRLKKNKIRLSKFKDLIGFIKQFMSQAAIHLQLEGLSSGLYKMKGFYRKTGRARKWPTKEKIGLFGGWDIFSLGKENWKKPWSVGFLILSPQQASPSSFREPTLPSWRTHWGTGQCHRPRSPDGMFWGNEYISLLKILVKFCLNVLC